MFKIRTSPFGHTKWGKMYKERLIDCNQEFKRMELNARQQHDYYQNLIDAGCEEVTAKRCIELLEEIARHNARQPKADRLPGLLLLQNQKGKYSGG